MHTESMDTTLNRRHIYHAIKQRRIHNQHNHKLSSAWALWRWSLAGLATVWLPQRCLSSQWLCK